jgi:NAD(P)-dependent dehydrogenase (short-subunit alcohol dehydrogenase family)
MTNSHWTSREIGDLSNRTIVVTGASSGLGERTARELARAGAHVVLAVRDLAKGRRVAAEINGSTEVRELDVANLASIRRFADGWQGSLDVLVNNAGIMQVPQGKTVDGFDLQIGTNYLGPFALTMLLLPVLTDRVVVISSSLYRQGHIDLADLNYETRKYNPLRAYRDSKLASMLFVLELQRRLSSADSAIRAVAAHPGLAPTNLATHVAGPAGFIQRRITNLLGNDLEHAVLPVLYAASQDIPGGSYVGPDGFARLRGYPKLETPSKAAQDADRAQGLWTLSTRLTGTDQAGDMPAMLLKESA